jgi:23S rRNA pseudouridine2605 synthase
MNERVRIHKALADAGVASRRQAEQLVIAGRVAVNGLTAGVGQLVDPARDILSVDGRPLGDAPQARLYLVLAKPAGVTSTVSDRHAARTVLDLVPVELRRGAARLYPVGRLDRDSEGLLLLTNDGAWAQRLLHPRHGVEREYALGLERALDPPQQHELERGIVLEEGTARVIGLRASTAAERRRLEAKLGPGARRLNWYQVTLGQGMKRQVRRMFATVGAPVTRLVRVRVGTLRLGELALGDVRPLTATERGQLERLAADPSPGRGLVVSIDGPGGSGKSTVGVRAAAKLSYRFCDTGVLYRGLTYLAIERGADLDDADALVGLVGLLELAPDAELRYVRMLVDGTEVTDRLHNAAVDRDVSRVSLHAAVRAALLPVQRALAAQGRLIMAGRDIGTVVLPDADIKLYLDVSIEERARRRAAERGLATDARAVAQIEHELRRRDGIDSTREASPLRIPDGARLIDTAGNTLDQTVAQVVDIVRRAERGASIDD